MLLSPNWRNRERDRYDVQQLAKAGLLNPDILRDRYYKEVRPNSSGNEARHDLTLKLWLLIQASHFERLEGDCLFIARPRAFTGCRAAPPVGRAARH